jgi:hypothetical protein
LLLPAIVAIELLLLLWSFGGALAPPRGERSGPAEALHLFDLPGQPAPTPPPPPPPTAQIVPPPVLEVPTPDPMLVSLAPAPPSMLRRGRRERHATSTVRC